MITKSIYHDMGGAGGKSDFAAKRPMDRYLLIGAVLEKLEAVYRQDVSDNGAKITDRLKREDRDGRWAVLMLQNPDIAPELGKLKDMLDVASAKMAETKARQQPHEISALENGIQTFCNTHLVSDRDAKNLLSEILYYRIAADRREGDDFLVVAEPRLVAFFNQLEAIAKPTWKTEGVPEKIKLTRILRDLLSENPTLLSFTVPSS